MRTKGEDNLKFAGKTTIRLIRIMVSPLSVESQTFPLWPFLTHWLFPSAGQSGSNPDKSSDLVLTAQDSQKVSRLRY